LIVANAAPAPKMNYFYGGKKRRFCKLAGIVSLAGG
jgi:hypothetical protein